MENVDMSGFLSVRAIDETSEIWVEWGMIGNLLGKLKRWGKMGTVWK
jgi:hypothetical protein